MALQTDHTEVRRTEALLDSYLESFRVVQKLLGFPANRPTNDHYTGSWHLCRRPQETETLTGLVRTPFETPFETLQVANQKKGYYYMPEGHFWSDGEHTWYLRRFLLVEFTEEAGRVVATTYGEPEDEYGEGSNKDAAFKDLLTSLSDSLEFLEDKRAVLAPDSKRELTWLRGLVVPA